MHVAHHSMRVSWLARLAGVFLMLGALLPLAAPGAALAHERRNVGPYTFVVGWTGEPAYTNLLNGLDLRISNTADNSPVEGADKTLKAQVAFGGGAPKDLPLRAVSGKPGAYTSDIVPTKAGSFIFTFSGTIDGTAVNEKFESGPGRFDDAKDIASIQMPAAAPAAVATTAPAVQSQADQLAAAQGQVAQARTFGIAGIVLGLIGVGLAAWALTAARRPAGPVATTHATRPSAA